MNDNPYVKILNVMKKQSNSINTPVITLAEVINSTTIKVEDLQLDKEDLLINKDITLNAGDTVVVYPINNGQKYIILCKVV